MQMNLPEDFLAYVEGDGVDCASTTGEPGYFQLWAPAELAELNESYEVHQYAPGFLGFGSDGGGEMLAFDASGCVYKIPFLGMSAKDAQKIAASWSEVASRIRK